MLYFLAVDVVISISKFDQLLPYMVVCKKNVLVSVDYIYIFGKIYYIYLDSNK